MYRIRQKNLNFHPRLKIEFLNLTTKLVCLSIFKYLFCSFSSIWLLRGWLNLHLLPMNIYHCVSLQVLFVLSVVVHLPFYLLVFLFCFCFSEVFSSYPKLWGKFEIHMVQSIMNRQRKTESTFLSFSLKFFSFVFKHWPLCHISSKFKVYNPNRIKVWLDVTFIYEETVYVFLHFCVN